MQIASIRCIPVVLSVLIDMIDRDTHITVAIPTFSRERPLIDTIQVILDQSPRPSGILIVDQSASHDVVTTTKLREWRDSSIIEWIHLDKPSIPKAMNVALVRARSPVVLFLDDDVVPAPALVATHVASYCESNDIWAIVGQVLQPGREPTPRDHYSAKAGLFADLDFPFNSTAPAFVKSVMAGNLSVRREKALSIGGFDENFIGVAYRFETEFARRIWRNGGKVLFQPSAGIRHLRAPHGGVRSYGDHLRSASPAHGVGDYYFALRHGFSLETLAYMARRPFREVCTSFHLRHPWWIPVKLLGELRAFLLALSLAAKGPKYVQRK